MTASRIAIVVAARLVAARLGGCHCTRQRPFSWLAKSDRIACSLRASAAAFGRGTRPLRCARPTTHTLSVSARGRSRSRSGGGGRRGAANDRSRPRCGGCCGGGHLTLASGRLALATSLLDAPGPSQAIALAPSPLAERAGGRNFSEAYPKFGRGTECLPPREEAFILLLINHVRCQEVLMEMKTKTNRDI